jgi:LacI family transcriptional regulator
MPITQKQLAEELGVAQVTVSCALRGQKGMKESLRRRILAAAEKHGYSIDSSNHEARLMRQRAAGVKTKANVICAIVFDEDDSSGFGGRILHGMNHEGDVIGSEIVMVTRCRSHLPLIVSRQQVDGAIRLLSDVDIDKGVTASPVPWVSLFYDVPDIDVVTVDNLTGAREVGRHLCRQGHKRIAFIGPDTDLARERLAGIRAAAAEAGTNIPDDLVRLEKFVANEGPTRLLLEKFIDGRHPPLPFTALVAYNDYMAEIALRFFAEKGLRVPEDVSVAGFDGALPSLYHETRRITTAAIPLEEVGAAAVRLLEWRLRAQGAPRRKVLLETALVEGDTVGPLAAARN